MKDIIASLREAVNEVMHYQFTHSKPAMHALQTLIDEANSAANEIERLRRALDIALEIKTGEPHIDGWPLHSGLPPPGDTALLRQALEALESVSPYTDTLTCYASTLSEHPQNAIDGAVTKAIAALRKRLTKETK